MLKAVPNKNAGFIILLTSIFTFFFFGEIRNLTTLSLLNNNGFSLSSFFLSLISFLWIGAQFPQEKFLSYGRILTLHYYFLLIHPSSWNKSSKKHSIFHGHFLSPTIRSYLSISSSIFAFFFFGKVDSYFLFHLHHNPTVVFIFSTGVSFAIPLNKLMKMMKVKKTKKEKSREGLG